MANGAIPQLTVPAPAMQTPPALQMPGSGFDLSRGYLPIMVVITLILGAFGLGSYIQAFRQERSDIVTRLVTLEKKVDRLLIRGTQIARSR